MKTFKKNLTLNDCIYLCMRNGKWWTFWNLQQVISEKTGKFYGEPTISAAIRNLRKVQCIEDYDLHDSTIEKRRIDNSRGYEYRIVFSGHSRSLPEQETSVETHKSELFMKVARTLEGI